MKFLMHGANIAAALICALIAALLTCLVMQNMAVASLSAGLPWQPGSFTAALGYVCSLLALGILLLWREQRHRSSMDGLQRSLTAETALRSGAEQGLLDAHGQLRQLRQQQEKIRKNERWRIARDIHDDLGQNLLALKMDITMLQASAAALHPSLQPKLALIAGNVDMSVRSLRCIINDLRPLVLDVGLRLAIDRLLDEFMRGNDVACELTVGAAVFTDSASKDIDTMVFRIVQEALSNIARHAHAKRVAIALDIEAASLVMTVRDDGVGMRAGPPKLGRGLRGIEDRVKAAGGSLRIDTQLGHGTTLALSIPLPASRVDILAWQQTTC